MRKFFTSIPKSMSCPKVYKTEHARVDNVAIDFL